MSQFLCLTVRFLQPLAHGRGDGGEPEWPPSPLRLFQALVAASAARWNERLRLDHAVPALEWLAKQPAPAVIAAVGAKSDVKYRLYVPDNVGDKVAKSWAGGNATASIADYRTEKDVRPTHLAGDAVHYLYPIADPAEFAKHKETLVAAARSVTHLGWGVDMVAGNAAELTEDEVAKLAGERWEPTADASATQLRVPRAGTLEKLMDKHTAFLNRLSGEGFKPVPPLTAFDTVGYRRDTDPAPRPWVVFEVHRTVAALADLPPGKSRFRPFDPVRTPDFARKGPNDPCGAVVLAGLVRHATAAAARASGWLDEARVVSFVEGHGDQKNGQATTDDRLMYLPLPSITPLKVEAIRRVVVAGPPGADLGRLGRLLHGRELTPEGGGDAVAMLAVGARADGAVGPYVGRASVWATVTPVMLPGFDDPDGVRRRLGARDRATPMSAEEKAAALAGLNRRTRELLLRAFEQSGLGAVMSAGALDRGEAELDWREVGFRPGVDLARRYGHNTSRYPRYHVRVRFARPVRGPLAVGAGRYRGLGLFAAVEV